MGDDRHRPRGLDMLRSRKSRREESPDVHVPEPIVSREDGTGPEQEALLADSVGLDHLTRSHVRWIGVPAPPTGVSVMRFPSGVSWNLRTKSTAPASSIPCR